MTSYQKIFSSFLRKIEDSSLAKLSDEDQTTMLTGWLDDAIGMIELDDLKIKSDLSDRDNNKQSFTANLYNSEIEVISLYMVVAWYEPIVNSLEHTGMFWGSKDDKWSNQKDHYESTKKVQESYRIRARKYFRNYAYRHNDYIGGD